MNGNCCLQVKLQEAHFLKDSDLVGKQDPFIQFEYDNITFKTEVKDDAGKDALFNDIFLLEHIEA